MPRSFASPTRAARASEALADWDAFAPTAPQALTAILTLDGNGASAFGQYLGPERDLRRLIGRLGGSPTTGSAPYLTVQRRWAGGESSPRSSFAASSLYVGERLSARGRSAFVDAADSAGLILDAYGGAINRPRRGDTAFPHRDERFSVQVLSYASNASTRVKQARARIAPYGSGAYANYADPDLDGALRAYYGANLTRLRRIKLQLDPANRFRPAQGIR